MLTLSETLPVASIAVDHAARVEGALNVPVLVVIIDTPHAIRELWPIVDEVTSEVGLVTSELVPASHGLPTSFAGRPRAAVGSPLHPAR